MGRQMDDCFDLRPRHCRKLIEEGANRIASVKVIEEALDWHIGVTEYRYAARANRVNDPFP